MYLHSTQFPEAIALLCIETGDMIIGDKFRWDIIDLIHISPGSYTAVLDNAGWVEEKINYSLLSWLHCAECNSISYLDYLCTTCRAK